MGTPPVKENNQSTPRINTHNIIPMYCFTVRGILSQATHNNSVIEDCQWWRTRRVLRAGERARWVVCCLQPISDTYFFTFHRLSTRSIVWSAKKSVALSALYITSPRGRPVSALDTCVGDWTTRSSLDVRSINSVCCTIVCFTPNKAADSRLRFIRCREIINFLATIWQTLQPFSSWFLSMTCQSTVV